MNMDNLIEVSDDKPLGSTIIKVVGVGGAGCNALNHMVRSGVRNVEFVAINTDAQALADSLADVTLQLGQSGQGAGMKPEVARGFAETQREEIRTLLQGADMVFIAAGMGKGTGTGASIVVAQVAKELGALTVGVVTKPFSFEGKKKMEVAAEAADEMAITVDSLITTLNARLEDIYPDALQKEWFVEADEVLKNAVASIAEIINVRGHTNVDFNDVKTTMSINRGRALMGSARATGEGRAIRAAHAAVMSPLLEGIELTDAKGVLVNITGNENNYRGNETKAIMNTVCSYCSPDVNPIFGVAYDESMGDDLRVTVIISGLGHVLPKINLVADLRTGTYDAHVLQPSQGFEPAPLAEDTYPVMTHAVEMHNTASGLGYVPTLASVAIPTAALSSSGNSMQNLSEPSFDYSSYDAPISYRKPAIQSVSHLNADLDTPSIGANMPTMNYGNSVAGTSQSFASGSTMSLPTPPHAVDAIKHQDYDVPTFLRNNLD